MHVGSRTWRFGAALILSAGAGGTVAQQSISHSEGLREATPRHVAIVNARVVAEPGRNIERGSVIVRDGLIVEVLAGEKVPAGAHRFDARGKTVFAAFIDSATTLGVPQAFRPAPPPNITPGAGRPAPSATSAPDDSGPRHWNRRVRPERDVAAVLELAADDIKALRALGFAAALAVPESGVLRGQSALLALRDGVAARERVLATRVAQHAEFETANAFGGEYPGSLMGAIALIRQTLHDARWQRDELAALAKTPGRARPEANLALAALEPVLARDQRLVFALEDELDAERALAIATEFGLDAALIGTGAEYRVLPGLARAKVPVVVPLAFPPAPEIEKPEVALATSLADLQHWEQAPANPARLADAGVPIALTTRGLKDAGKDFWPNLRRAVAAGLSEEQALAALTVAPAELVGMGARLGRIAPGRIANLLIADAELFRAENAAIYSVFVDGVAHEVKPIAPVDPRGTWRLSWSDGRGPAEIVVSGDGPSYEVKANDEVSKASLADNRLLLAAPSDWFTPAASGTEPLSLMIRDDALEGVRLIEHGGAHAVTGKRSRRAETTAPKLVEQVRVPEFRGYPAGEYARIKSPPQPRALLVRNATIWTMGPQGRIDQGQLLVRAGKIAAVGRELDAPANAEIVDAEGGHVLPGIVDAHSHTAIARNLNEPSHAVTTEVRIGDALDPTDISIYRQLAGGVTSALLLHGSANPMGGQSQTVKFRWGEAADGLRFDGAPSGIKFALGENVKQANWGDAFVTRYPQSRMGVEQIMLDTFNAARAYGERLAAWERRKQGPAPRRDLRLEAVLEILRGERRVHIHSYRQDEILMFARLAERFGFRIATFQHVLEGYKVADVLAAAGAGASTFSDWWAFKVEVYDAIPHNAALMVRQGVITSINSDSDEMARRLNAEAAKSMRNGGLSAEQALAMITINPARQLGIEARVGSLEPGKDADFALWNVAPTSAFARVEQTWIDGRKYFDRDQDRVMQAEVIAERERLIEKALPERQKLAGGPPKGNGGAPPTAPPVSAHLERLYGREVALHTLTDFAIRYAPYRGIYHDGADIMACSVAGHVH
jgi:imidazolonepropionase-like amidohydrolase